MSGMRYECGTGSDHSPFPLLHESQGVGGEGTGRREEGKKGGKSRERRRGSRTGRKMEEKKRVGGEGMWGRKG